MAVYNQAGTLWDAHSLVYDAGAGVTTTTSSSTSSSTSTSSSSTSSSSTTSTSTSSSSTTSSSTSTSSTTTPPPIVYRRGWIAKEYPLYGDITYEKTRGESITEELSGAVIYEKTRGSGKVVTYTKSFPDTPTYDESSVTYDSSLYQYNYREIETKRPGKGEIETSY